MSINGKLGTVINGAGAVTNVLKWTFAGTAEVPKFNTNTSNGVKDATCGPIDSKGTVEIVLDINPDGSGGGVPWGPGETVTLELLADRHNPDTKITTEAIIASAPLEADINGGSEQKTTYGFEGKGPWTATGKFANYVPGGNSATAAVGAQAKTAGKK